MRVLPIFAAAVLLVGTALADDPKDKQDRERRVRVALALAHTSPQTGEVCGVCRDDVEACRKEGLKEGKPVVLFVGGPCDGLGKTAEAAGAIPAKAPSYSGDDRPAAEKRIVVLEPKADGSGLMIAATLPAKSEAKDVTKAVREATPAKVEGKKLDWSH